jgi:hypothetical protein
MCMTRFVYIASARRAATRDRTGDHIDATPTLAVIPFVERAAAPEHQVVGEVLADVIIAALSRSSELDVISRLSTTRGRDRSRQIRTLCQSPTSAMAPLRTRTTAPACSNLPSIDGSQREKRRFLSCFRPAITIALDVMPGSACARRRASC